MWLTIQTTRVQGAIVASYWTTGARFLDLALNLAIAIGLLFSTFIWKLLSPYEFLVSFVAFDKELMPETSAFQIFRDGKSTFINSFDKTKFLYNHLSLFSGLINVFESWTYAETSLIIHNRLPGKFEYDQVWRENNGPTMTNFDQAA